MTEQRHSAGQSFIQWGVLRPSGDVEVFGVPGTQGSENMARAEAQAEGSTLVSRTITISPWDNGQPETCVHGHPRTEENTYWTRDGRRNCRVCRRVNSRKSKAKMRTYSRTPIARMKAQHLSPEESTARLDEFLRHQGVA